MFRSSIVSFVFLLVVAGPSFAQQSFVSQEGRYKIAFPGEPKEETKIAPLPTGGTLALHVATMAASREKVYITIYCDYPEETANTPAQTTLGKVRDGTKGAKGEISGDKEITLSLAKEKVPGREFTIKTGDIHQRYRIYLKGTRLYQILVAGSSPEFVASKEATKFLSSFKITK